MYHVLLTECYLLWQPSAMHVSINKCVFDMICDAATARVVSMRWDDYVTWPRCVCVCVTCSLVQCMLWYSQWLVKSFLYTECQGHDIFAVFFHLSWFLIGCCNSFLRHLKLLCLQLAVDVTWWLWCCCATGSGVSLVVMVTLWQCVTNDILSHTVIYSCYCTCHACYCGTLYAIKFY